MDTKQALQQALTRLLRPLARLLLNQGLGVDEFTELAKQAYVDIAEQEFSLEGRKQSTSRIAVLTGMHRKEVARLRQHQPKPDQARSEGGRISRVISGWCNDKDFLGDDGEPRALTVEQFAELVNRYSGNMTSRATLDEMLRVEAVSRCDGLIELNNKVYVPQNCDAERLQLMGEASADLLNTLSINLADISENRLQLSTSYDNLPIDIIEELKTLCQQRSSELLREVDQFLARHDRDSSPATEGHGRMRAGLGIYYIEESLEQPQE